jgi:hypothetical protein
MQPTVISDPPGVPVALFAEHRNAGLIPTQGPLNGSARMKWLFLILCRRVAPGCEMIPI